MKKKLIISCLLLMSLSITNINSQEKKTDLEIGKEQLFYGKAHESIVSFKKALSYYQAKKIIQKLPNVTINYLKHFVHF